MTQGDRMMLSAVDDAKDKPGTLRALSDAIKAQKEAKAVIWKAIFPPMVLLPGVAGFSYVLATQSIPIIVKVAPPEVWTPFNQAVRDVAEYLANHGAITAIGVIAAIVAFAYALPRWKALSPTSHISLKIRSTVCNGYCFSVCDSVAVNR